MRGCVEATACDVVLWIGATYISKTSNVAEANEAIQQPHLLYRLIGNAKKRSVSASIMLM